MKKCNMCGMELLPYRKEYHMGKNSKSDGVYYVVIRPKSFCDMKCKAYFDRRLNADLTGVPLKE